MRTTNKVYYAVTRTSKEHTVKVTAVDMLNEKFHTVNVKCYDFGKDSSKNRVKVEKACLASPDYKAHWIVGKFEVVETKEVKRGMTAEKWMECSVIIDNDEEVEETEI